jgi:hypothetical protein
MRRIRSWHRRRLASSAADRRRSRRLRQQVVRLRLADLARRQVDGAAGSCEEVRMRVEAIGGGHDAGIGLDEAHHGAQLRRALQRSRLPGRVVSELRRCSFPLGLGRRVGALVVAFGCDNAGAAGLDFFRRGIRFRHHLRRPDGEIAAERRADLRVTGRLGGPNDCLPRSTTQARAPTGSLCRASPSGRRAPSRR